MRKFLTLFITIILTFTYSAGIMTQTSFALDKKSLINKKNTVAKTDNKTLNLEAGFAVAIDYDTGKILYNKNGDSKLFPASTTKIWTAYNVLKDVKDLNSVVKIENMPPISGSCMYLKNGESFTVWQLLEGMLIHSSNDAAYVLARYVGNGNVNKFIETMNKEAKSIGATNTHFDNPNGLPDNNHYTTAHDMALMARVAMHNDLFKKIVKTRHIEFNATQENPYKRSFANTNRLLTDDNIQTYDKKLIPKNYDYIDGIKTGFTDAAGKCLLTSAVKQNRRVISAVYHSTNQGVCIDSKLLLNYAFNNFHDVTIVDKNQYKNSKEVPFTDNKNLIYQPDSDYKCLVSNSEKTPNYNITTKLREIKLPIKNGDIVGNLQVKNDKNEVVKNINLVSQNNLNSLFPFGMDINMVVISLAIIVIIIIVIIVSITTKKSKKKFKH